MNFEFTYTVEDRIVFPFFLQNCLLWENEFFFFSIEINLIAFVYFALRQGSPTNGVILIRSEVKHTYIMHAIRIALNKESN